MADRQLPICRICIAARKDEKSTPAPRRAQGNSSNAVVIYTIYTPARREFISSARASLMSVRVTRFSGITSTQRIKIFKICAMQTRINDASTPQANALCQPYCLRAEMYCLDISSCLRQPNDRFLPCESINKNPAGTLSTLIVSKTPSAFINNISIRTLGARKKIKVQRIHASKNKE